MPTCITRGVARSGLSHCTPHMRKTQPYGRRGTKTKGEEIASPQRSNQAQNPGHEQSSAVDADPSVPPPTLPRSVGDGLGREWHRLWGAFQHDVNATTDSLLHLLDGIHSKHVAERRRLTQVLANSKRRSQDAG